MYIAHHDDGKGKWQSHEISLVMEEGDTVPNIFEGIYGYGETEEKAYQEFIKNISYIYSCIGNVMHQLTLYDLKSEECEISHHEVDYAGKIVE